MTIRTTVLTGLVAWALGGMCEADGGDAPLAGVPWPATDGLGRQLPMAADVGKVRPDRFVGIFYFLWHQHPGGRSTFADGPHDVSRILARDPDAFSKPDSPLWGNVTEAHYWGQPLYGYYRSDDAWVLRRHAYLLADAGVDVLIFDTTNALTYPQVYRQLCEVFTELRSRGETTPQIAFMVNTEAGRTAQAIYEDIYRPGQFQPLWFHWRGKPLMICDPGEASPELREFFTLRRAHWPFTMENTQRAWHWEATYPQPYGYVDDEQKPEQLNVSVAQNLRRSDGLVTNMSKGDARGRSFHDGQMDPRPDSVNYGYNFQEQWSRAFELDPPFVMITGWNEWIAQRFKRPGEPLVFIDQYNQEFSRDIEFAKRGHLDNYYYQMVANIRRYKGAASLPAVARAKTIDLNGGFEPWESIAGGFVDHVGETTPRDHAGTGGTHYRNDSGRNDLEIAKTTADGQLVYFYLRCTKPIDIDPAGKLWLLVDVDQQHRTGWQGYDLLIGRHVVDGQWSLETHESAWQWQRAAMVDFRCEASELQLAVPRSWFGSGNGRLSFDFKWADNLQQEGDAQDFYLSGDVAPEGRFNFRATIDAPGD